MGALRPLGACRSSVTTTFWLPKRQSRCCMSGHWIARKLIKILGKWPAKCSSTFQLPQNLTKCIRWDLKLLTWAAYGRKPKNGDASLSILCIVWNEVQKPERNLCVFQILSISKIKYLFWITVLGCNLIWFFWVSHINAFLCFWLFSILCYCLLIVFLCKEVYLTEYYLYDIKRWKYFP